MDRFLPILSLFLIFTLFLAFSLLSCSKFPTIFGKKDIEPPFPQEEKTGFPAKAFIEKIEYFQQNITSQDPLSKEKECLRQSSSLRDILHAKKEQNRLQSITMANKFLAWYSDCYSPLLTYPQILGPEQQKIIDPEHIPVEESAEVAVDKEQSPPIKQLFLQEDYRAITSYYYQKKKEPGVELSWQPLDQLYVGLALGKTGYFQDGVMEIEIFLQQDHLKAAPPSRIFILSNLADYYFNLKQFEKAEKIYKQVLQLHQQGEKFDQICQEKLELIQQAYIEQDNTGLKILYQLKDRLQREEDPVNIYLDLEKLLLGDFNETHINLALDLKRQLKYSIDNRREQLLAEAEQVLPNNLALARQKLDLALKYLPNSQEEEKIRFRLNDIFEKERFQENNRSQLEEEKEKAIFSDGLEKMKSGDFLAAIHEFKQLIGTRIEKQAFEKLQQCETLFISQERKKAGQQFTQARREKDPLKNLLENFSGNRYTNTLQRNIRLVEKELGEISFPDQQDKE